MDEIEGRGLNVMVFNKPESKQEDVKEMQREDTELLKNIMKQKMNLDMQDIQVFNPRFGRRGNNKWGNDEWEAFKILSKSVSVRETSWKPTLTCVKVKTRYLTKST